MNNNQATLQKLEQMKFYGMARAFTNTMETGVTNQFTADELLSHLATSPLLKRSIFLWTETLIKTSCSASPAVSG